MRGLGAVHGDVEGGVVVWLLHAQIDEAGHGVQVGEDLVGDDPVAGDVCPFNLDVDGCGQAEVEDLGDDVGGQKVEGGAGELAGKLGAESADEVLGGGVVLVERYQDVGVAGADQAGGGVLGVQGGVGQADVVQDVVELGGWDGAANLLLHQIADFGGVFNAGATGSAQVENERPAVAGGKEVLAKKWDEQACAQADEEKEAGTKRRRMSTSFRSEGPR